jgi:hypothetical protein
MAETGSGEVWREQWEHLRHAYLGDDRLLQVLLTVLREGREVDGEIRLPLAVWQRLIERLEDRWRTW